MAQQRVFVVMQRTDIPSSLLQLTELKPNDSQRNYIYEPPGQTQYVKNIPINDTVATTGAGPITTDAAYNGIAAYLIDRVEDQVAGLTALTAAMANDTATDIVAAAQAGTLLDAATIGGLLVGNGAGAGTTLVAGDSTGSLEDVLGILMRRNYLLPGGTEVEDVGNDFVATISGSFTNDGEYKQLYETSSFKISNGDGQLANFKDAGFTYLDVAGSALTVYAEDGTLL